MKKIFSVMAAFLLFLSACGNDGDHANEEKPVYNIPISREETETQAGIEKQEEDDGVEDERPVGEALFADFKGVGEQETGSTNTSDFRNEDYGMMMSSIVCSDRQGTIYYVNYGTYEDNYIYSYRDGKRELLVDKICNYINLYEGSLYFLVSETPPDPMAFSWGGKLYRYHLETKETELLLDENVCNLYVGDGIMYFCDELWGDENGNTYGNEWYSMKIGDTKPEKMGRLLPFFYGDYQLAYSDEDDWITGLVLTDGKEDIPLINETNLRMYRFTIVGDKLWICHCTEEGIPAVSAINLADGTRKTYAATLSMRNGGNMPTDAYFGFAVIDGRIYAVSNGNIVAYDESEECFYILVFDKTNYTGLYTDGENLYGLACYGQPYQEHTNSIVRIKPDDTQITWESDLRLREVISE